MDREKINLDFIQNGYFSKLINRYIERLLDLNEINVFGVLLFGSVARGEEKRNNEYTSDIDLLIIIEEQGLPEKYIDRISFEVELMFGYDRGIEAIWWNLSELNTALNNKMSMILDAMDEGKILYDPKKILKNARESLLKELKLIGVRKRKNSWVWPLEKIGDKIIF